MQLAVEFRLIDELRVFDRNSRKHSASQVALLVASIERWGFTNPLLVDGDQIVAGHGRLAAVRKIFNEGRTLRLPDGRILPQRTVPVLSCSGWSEEQRRAYVIADNSLGLASEWDEDLLRGELGSLRGDGFDPTSFGFGAGFVDQLLAGHVAGDGKTDPDECPAAPLRAFSRPGDVWVLGAHRVVCGDSTDSASWSALMGEDLADAAWCDPPYNVAYKGKAGKIQNDDLSAGDFGKLLDGMFACMYASMRAGAPIYVAHADTEGLAFRRAFQDAGFKLSGVLIWQKDILVLGRSDYHWMHEPILYGWRPGAPHSWYGGRKRTTIAGHGERGPIRRLADGRWAVIVGDQTLIVDGAAELIEAPSGIVHCPKPKRSPEHPTMKPTALIEAQLSASALPGNIVIDCCAGSGSTLIACERLGMKARVVELDPLFVDVIVRRWQDYSGGRAVREGDGAAMPPK